MLDVITEVHERSKKYLAPIVRFERMAVEDRQASVNTGRYVAKDVDFAFITPPFSRDEVVKKAKTFLDDNRMKVERGQMPQEIADRYRNQYEAWLKGQELPLEGTPIKGWSVISPAQQAMLIERKILTVEMLAQANDEGIRMIGMGGQSMRQLAQNWLAQANDKGPLTLQMSAVQNENTTLKGSIETLMKQVAALQEVAKIQPLQQAMNQTNTSPEITLSDVLDVDPPRQLPQKKR